MDRSVSAKLSSRASFLRAGVLALLACVAGGCVSSSREAFLAVRAEAPSPRVSSGLTLAEAERSSGNRGRLKEVARLAEVPDP
jgi:hypothetical protein